MKHYGEFAVRSWPGQVMQAGEATIGHRHCFDHLTAVWGHMRIDTLSENLEEVLSSEELGEHLDKTLMLVPKGVCHRITSLKDGSFSRCIYIAREDPDAYR